MLIIVTGPQVGIAAIKRGAVPPGLTAEQFLVLPFAGALMFAIFVALGVVQRNNAQAHKRLMLLATISILDAAIARMPGMLDAGPLVFFALSDLLHCRRRSSTISSAAAACTGCGSTVASPSSSRRSRGWCSRRTAMWASFVHFLTA